MTTAATKTAAKTVSIELGDGIRERIERLADAKRCTPQGLVREAVAEYISREEKREAFRQETLASWQEYQETGLHITQEEVDNWLASWGAEKELPTPVCHK